MTGFGQVGPAPGDAGRTPDSSAIAITWRATAHTGVAVDAELRVDVMQLLPRPPSPWSGIQPRRRCSRCTSRRQSAARFLLWGALAGLRQAPFSEKACDPVAQRPAHRRTGLEGLNEPGQRFGVEHREPRLPAGLGGADGQGAPAAPPAGRPSGHPLEPHPAGALPRPVRRNRQPAWLGSTCRAGSVEQYETERKKKKKPSPVLLGALARPGRARLQRRLSVAADRARQRARCGCGPS